MTPLTLEYRDERFERMIRDATGVQCEVVDNGDGTCCTWSTKRQASRIANWMKSDDRFTIHDRGDDDDESFIEFTWCALRLVKA